MLSAGSTPGGKFLLVHRSNLAVVRPLSPRLPLLCAICWVLRPVVTSECLCLKAPEYPATGRDLIMMINTPRATSFGKLVGRDGDAITAIFGDLGSLPPGTNPFQYVLDQMGASTSIDAAGSGRLADPTLW